ncbi:MAG: hypothetical protein KAR21_25135, partial [Spirochaetales bacterium]|nr:hypothetical protein [Spirochaetales bacterium]
MISNLQVMDTHQIIGHLNDLSTKTEYIFLKLAGSLPALFREIEGGMNKANHLIDLFSNENASINYNEQDNLIANGIDRAETLVGDASDFFIALEGRDSKLFDAINNSIDCLAAL